MRFQTSRSASLALVAALSTVTAPALAQEADDDRSVVAVLRYDNNTGDEQYDHLGRALSSMMISDLSALDRIRLVERERIEELLDELDLQQSAYVDPESAQNVGMIIGAQYVVFGAFVSAEPEMRLDTRIARSETSEIVTAAEVTGQREALFDLQQRLADELIDRFGLVLTEEERARLRAQQESNRIDDVQTLLLYGRVLCLLDNGSYPEALESAQDLERRAPGSAVVGATMSLLRDRAADEARSRVENQARSRLGGLLGRRAPEPTPSGC